MYYYCTESNNIYDANEECGNGMDYVLRNCQLAITQYSLGLLGSSSIDLQQDDVDQDWG